MHVLMVSVKAIGFPSSSTELMARKMDLRKVFGLVMNSAGTMDLLKALLGFQSS